MKQFWHLSLFQLKDKIDFSWVKSRKTLIQAIVFGILKFAIVTALAFALLYLLTLIGFVNKYQDALPLFTIFLGVMFVLNIASSTYNLTRTLYFADDNRVLITFPVTANKLFFSRIFVYFIFELKKSLGILVPVILGFLIFEIIGYKGTEITIWSFFWMPIPIIIFVLIQVLFASILSIPFLYVYRFLKRNSIIELIGIAILVGAGLLLVIRAISLIPADIDLDIQWPAFVSSFEDFVIKVDRYMYPINFYSRVFTGEFGAVVGTHYGLNGLTFLKALIALGAAALLGLIAFLLIRPFYFKMMNKTFEFDNNANLVQRKNIKHKKYVTFANKEFKLSFRDFDISGSYLAIYIIVPILLFFMNKVISAISTSMRGDNIAIAVNLLLTILPLLASNSTIATMYSKEGRTAYITKSNPVNPFVPLTSKLLFNLIFCVPSIVGCAIIFGYFVDGSNSFKIVAPILFALSVLLLQYAHIFFCAAQDLMNPQNEAYATSGSDFNNPNETRATIAAFAISFIVAVFFYFMLTESIATYNNYLSAFIRLFIISAALFAGLLYLFIKKVQVFYYEK